MQRLARTVDNSVELNNTLARESISSGGERFLFARIAARGLLVVSMQKLK